MPVMQYTRSEFEDLLAHTYPDPEPVKAMIDKWLRRGDGAAVYQNADLGHQHQGHVKIVSYGSAKAQLEVPAPPARLPDIGQDINWRYQLAGVYRGPKLGSEPLPRANRKPGESL